MTTPKQTTTAPLPSTSPPPYTTISIPSTPRPYHVLPALPEDEEWTCGFWGEHPVFDEKTDCHQTPYSKQEQEEWELYDLCCYYSAVLVCILACFGAFFVLGLMGRYFHLGLGTDAWSGFAGLGNDAVEMQFCQGAQNRQAPGPQTWTYMPPNSGRVCHSETITLSVDAGEAWKLNVDDQISIARNRRMYVKPQDSDEFVQFRAYRPVRGDDLGEEGGAGRHVSTW